MMQNFIDQQRAIRTYGRTRSHGLSPMQEDNLRTLYPIFGITLPEEPMDPRNFFHQYFDMISFEIGFGNGEHLIGMAKKNPNIGFIGCEPFENGVVSALDSIQKNNLSNVRIYKGDARTLLNKLLNHSIDRMYILFPDPWRKKKHHKRRLISEGFLQLAREKMKSNSCMVIATDHEDYRNDILKLLHNSNIVFNDELIYARPSCFIGTKYERKAIAKGVKCAYIRAYWWN